MASITIGRFTSNQRVHPCVGESRAHHQASGTTRAQDFHRLGHLGRSELDELSDLGRVHVALALLGNLQSCGRTSFALLHPRTANSDPQNVCPSSP
jgi:hypothetical protein